MTKSEWQKSRDLAEMVEWLRSAGKVSDRKLRLWACKCVRRVWKLLPEGPYQNAVTIAEGLAEGLTKSGRQRDAWNAASSKNHTEVGDVTEAEVNAWAAARALLTSDTDFDQVYVHAALAAAGAAGHYLGERAFHAVVRDESAAQAALLRHFVGNPFLPLLVPPAWPREIVRLAEALYAGEPCSAALHDALLEADLVEFAEHFHEADHPKGCYWLDLILEKS